MSLEQRTSRGTNGVLAACRAGGRAALIGYLPVGYPDVPTSIRAMETLCDNGIDIVEVGMPYSDPLMDGAVIQRAATQALERGVHVEDVFRATAAVRAKGVPPLVMSYWNLVLRRGVARYAADLAAAGGAGLITPDHIPDEAQDWVEASKAHGLDRGFLALARKQAAGAQTPELPGAMEQAVEGGLTKLGRATIGLGRLSRGLREEDLPRLASAVVTADRPERSRIRRDHQRLATAFGAELISWPGATHGVHLDHPEEVLAVVRSVIGAAAGQAPR